jgi:hypothetical protein
MPDGRPMSAVGRWTGPARAVGRTDGPVRAVRQMDGPREPLAASESPWLLAKRTGRWAAVRLDGSWNRFARLDGWMAVLSVATVTIKLNFDTSLFYGRW